MTIYRRPGILLAILLGLFTCLALIVHAGFFAPLDQTLSATLAAYRGWPIDLVNWVASVQVWTPIVIVAAILLWLRGRRQLGVLLIVADVSAELVSFLAKVLIARPRPPGAHLTDLVVTNSFPSGHLVRVAVTLATLVAFYAWDRPKWRWPFATTVLALILVVGVARVVSGEHWPSDVVGGYMLAGAWTDLLLISAIWRARRRAGGDSPLSTGSRRSWRGGSDVRSEGPPADGPSHG